MERGRLANVPLGKLVRLADTLGARADLRLLWQGERLDRLLDAAHAAAVDEAVQLLTRKGWQVAPEVSFSVYGERGAIDVLAFHPATAVLLVVEVKSTIPDVQATIAVLDRKVRLAAGIGRQRGWAARGVGRLLVVRAGRTAYRRVSRHRATFAAALPQRGHSVRAWIDKPSLPPISGLLFLPAGRGTNVRRRVRRILPFQCAS